MIVPHLYSLWQTRTEIHHLSPKVSLSLLMPLRFILALLCAAEHHKPETCTAGEMALWERSVNVKLRPSISLGFAFPQSRILCHLFSFSCWMQPSSSQWCRKWSGCPWHFLSSQKWSESSLDFGRAYNWTSILFQKYMRLAFFYSILHCALNWKI